MKKATKKSHPKQTKPRPKVPAYLVVWKVVFNTGFDYFVTEETDVATAARKAGEFYGKQDNRLVKGIEQVSLADYL